MTIVCSDLKLLHNCASKNVDGCQTHSCCRLSLCSCAQPMKMLHGVDSSNIEARQMRGFLKGAQTGAHRAQSTF